MPIPAALTVRLSAVTPLFIGGAEPNERAELRPPSIKGLLRYWYRALDGNYQQHERRYFGSTDEGQAACLLQVDRWLEGDQQWDQNGYRRYQRMQDGKPVNGIGYLTYTLRMSPNNRRAITAGTNFTLTIQPRPGEDTREVRRAWITALWMLVHVGGLGTRARRGVGSLRIDDWSGWPECAVLPLPCRAERPEQWHAEAGKAIGQTILPWFRDRPERDHTTLASGSRFLLLRRGYPSWEDALNDAGARLQQFRQEMRDDLAPIRAQITNQALLRVAPARTGFGLPLAFRFPRVGNLTLIPESHNRMASPLFVRVVRLNDDYHGGYVYLPGPVPPGGVRVQGGPTVPWSEEARRVVATFFDAQVRAGQIVGFTIP